ncbi:prolyl oligopeptidase family serine peptidase [Pendulispora rubella]|uniref:prolyl oligopeptidase n=1 Tax=Pendulispora rubella TaxID=2741070 RepID=A0ABZ2LBU1_9BACT
MRFIRPTSMLLLGMYGTGAMLLGACGGEPAPAHPEQAIAPQADASTERTTRLPHPGSVTETLHGVTVEDPFRALENGDSPEVKAWTDQQNAKTRQFLDAVPSREALKREIAELIHIGNVDAPYVAVAIPGERRYFHTKREGEQNQPTLYVRDKVGGPDRVLIDASALSADGTNAIDWWYPSRDGKFVAWGMSENGSEESTLIVRDVKTGKDLPDRIPYTRYASVAWVPGNKAFYYTRHPEPGSVPPGDEKYYSKVFKHVIGTDPKSDVLVFGAGREKTDTPSLSISPNGRWLVVTVHQGWAKSEVYLQDLEAKGKTAGKWVEVAVKTEALFDAIARDDRLYIHTNDGAPRYRLFAVDYKTPDRTHWKELIVEGADVLTDVSIIGKHLVATYLHDASTRIERFDINGKSKGAIPLPGIGTASVSGPYEGDEMFFNFYSYATPTQVSRVDLKTNKVELWDRVGEKFAGEKINVTLMHATSKDGTKVPMFVVAGENLAKNGETPTVLWGYGGFNINMTPAFSARALLTVRHGGVWVFTVLRGGGEFGEDWHKAGMLANKQNVFDDFIACAEEMVAQKISNPAHLGIAGGSNGGLLTATVATQRPELYRAGLSLVPLTDMVRYTHYRIAQAWIPEYGDPANADQFKVLYAYSPYHHVKDGTRYPAMLFTTAESDARVDPMHARKMAARMQEAQQAGAAADRPILVRVESKAGHGAGKPTSKVVEELADEMGFLFHELGVK